MEKECEACGKLFTTDNKTRKYCDICGKKGWHIKRRTDSQSAKIGRLYSEPKVHVWECKECGKIFKAPYNLLYHKERIDFTDEYLIFCSKKCHGNYLKKFQMCTECGKQLSKQAIKDYSPFVKATHFCSDKCKEKNYRDKMKSRGWIRHCEYCGKEFIRRSGWFCSQDCSRAARKEGWVRPEPKFEDDWF